MSDTLLEPWSIIGVESIQVTVRPGRTLALFHHPGETGNQTCVFLVHGAGGNRHQWRHQWQLFVQAGYRVLAWDQLGHGDSAQPADPRAYAGDELLEDYQQLIQEYGLARNILIGHSYGARLTLALLQKLEFEGRLGWISKAALVAPPALDFSLRSPLLYLPIWLLNRLQPQLEKGFRRAAWHPDTAAALIDHEESLARRNDLRIFRALARQASRLDRERLARLALPVLVLAGEQDGLTPASGAWELAGELPDAHFEVLAGAGHQLMLEQAEVVNRWLDEFLEGVSEKLR